MPDPAKIMNTYGRLYLLLGVIIFGASNSITRKLNQLGEQNLVDGHNPISLCNVLFVGNLCALILLGVIYHRQWRLSALKHYRLKDWLILLIVALLGSALVPALAFTALGLTTVNNVILISRIEPPLALALSIWFMGETVDILTLLGAIVSFLGVVLTIALQPNSGGILSGIGQGETFILIASIASALVTLMSRMSLRQIPLGFFSTFRLLVGTIAFASLVLILYSPSHFTEVASPFLWQWMLVYSAVIVVGGQFFWFKGLKHSSVSEVSLASTFNPIAGVLAAYFILGEAPTTAQYIGGGVILFGIALGQMGLQRSLKVSDAPPLSEPEMSEPLGFKGI
ncbi:MAG: DMT family transporter [Prochlorotrichaceae cyanobacterium]